MAGKVDKGFISKIHADPVDFAGHPRFLQVNPGTNSGAITPKITIPFYLRGLTGNLKVGDEVAYALFDDGTGVVIDKLSGDWEGVLDYPLEVTGDVLHDQTTTIVGDTTHKANVMTEGATTVQKQITGNGGMAISGGSGGAAATVSGTLKTTGDVVAGSISLQNHTHQEHGDGGGTTGPAQ